MISKRGQQARPLFPQLLRRALELIRGCDCRSVSGCPACTQHMGCTEYNAVLHKHAAIAVLELTLAAEIEYAERLRLQVCVALPCMPPYVMRLSCGTARLLNCLFPVRRSFSVTCRGTVVLFMQDARAHRGPALDGGHLGGQLVVQGGPADE